MSLTARLRPHLVDAFIVAVWIAAEVDAIVAERSGNEVALLLFPALWTLPLLARRRWPLSAALFTLAALALEAKLAYDGTESQVVLVPVIVAFYTIGRRADPPASILAGILGVVLGLIVVDSDTGPLTGSGLAFIAIISSAPFSAGVALRRRELEALELAGRARRLEHTQDERARAAVAEERSRLARELHDMIGHAISVITVQAGAARTVLDSDPARAKGALVAIEDTGRETLDEMRRLIGVLRDMGEPGLAPQPGMAQLDRLVQGVRDSGLRVELHREGAPVAELPPAVDLAAYRIVQEGLTNALKHGGQGSAVVTVRYALRSVALQIESE